MWTIDTCVSCVEEVVLPAWRMEVAFEGCTDLCGNIAVVGIMTRIDVTQSQYRATCNKKRK